MVLAGWSAGDATGQRRSDEQAQACGASDRQDDGCGGEPLGGVGQLVTDFGEGERQAHKEASDDADFFQAKLLTLDGEAGGMAG